MKLLIASDFHLLLARKENFTAESSARREAESRRLLLEILQTPHDEAVCVGDFFDRFSNSETGILEAAPIAQRFSAILAGNHDVSNRTDVRGSLDVIAEMTPGVVKAGSPKVETIENATLVWVPHQLTQEAFEDCLSAVMNQTRQATGWRLLFLHCTYDSPFSENLSSLNLTEDKAQELLGAFHHIFIGHEHNPKDLFDNRLHIVGSHFPVAFDQLVDHRHFVFDTLEGALVSIPHWRADEHVFVGPDRDAPDGRQFYDLTECVDARTPMRLFKAGALGVRVRSESKEPGREKLVHRQLSLPEQIEALLASQYPHLLPVWQDVRQQIDTQSPAA